MSCKTGQVLTIEPGIYLPGKTGGTIGKTIYWLRNRDTAS